MTQNNSFQSWENFKIFSSSEFFKFLSWNSVVTDVWILLDSTMKMLFWISQILFPQNLSPECFEVAKVMKEIKSVIKGIYKPRKQELRVCFAADAARNFNSFIKHEVLILQSSMRWINVLNLIHNKLTSRNKFVLFIFEYQRKWNSMRLVFLFHSSVFYFILLRRRLS